MINNPIVKIFTTFILAGLLIAPFTNGFWDYHDKTVTILYWIIAIYVLLKKAFDIWKSTKQSH